MELKKERLNDSPLCPNCSDFKHLMHQLGIASSNELEKSIQDLVIENKASQGFQRRLQTRLGVVKVSNLEELESEIFAALNRGQKITNN